MTEFPFHFVPHIKNYEATTTLTQGATGWEWSRLGDISSTNTGYAFKSSQYSDKGTFVLRVTNIESNGDIIKHDNKYISTDSANNDYKKFLLNRNDVLLVMVGGSLGKIGIVSQSALPAVLNQNIWRFSIYGEIPYKYFIHGIKYINTNQLTITKSTHGHLAQGEYLKRFFPLPPQAEQHRIVKKVDELMALCDQLEQQTEQNLTAHQTLVDTLLNALVNPEQDAAAFADSWKLIKQNFELLFTTEQSIDKLKQTILQLAVMGKLVLQDPNDEPASVLLEKIAIEKERLIKEKKITRQKSLPNINITNNEESFELPIGWERTRLDEIVNITSGITKGRKLSERKLVSVEYLRVANVQRSYLDLVNMKSIEIPEDEVQKFSVKKRDLLITEGGDWDKVGRTAIWNEELDYVAHQNHVFKARIFLQEQNEVWLEKYLNSVVARNYFASSSKQTTNLASINKTQLRGCIIAIPPTDEQHRIVKKVDQLMTLCDNLKSQLINKKITQQNLATAFVDKTLTVDG